MEIIQRFLIGEVDRIDELLHCRAGNDVIAAVLLDGERRLLDRLDRQFFLKDAPIRQSRQNAHNRAHQRVEALLRRGGNRINLNVRTLEMLLQTLKILFRARQIHLIGGDNLRPFGQIAIGDQLIADMLEILNRIAAFAARNIHHMHQQARALHVAQETDAQPHAFARALHQTGNIRHDEIHAVLAANTQIRGQRSEVIVRNLRPGRRHDGENRALADIRIADKTDVRNALEFQFKLGHFALLPRLGEIRRLAGRRGEMRVAPAAAAAVKQHMALTGLVHVGHQTTVRDQPHRRAHRHLDDKLFGALAAAQGRRAVFAVIRRILALITEIHQRVHIRIGQQHDVAAVSAVAAVRAAVLHKLFAMERDRAIAAVSGLGGDFNLIDKHSFLLLSLPSNPMGQLKQTIRAIITVIPWFVKGFIRALRRLARLWRANRPFFSFLRRFGKKMRGKPLLFRNFCAIIHNWHILVLHGTLQSQSPKGGERIMNKYELIYIIDTAVEETARKELIEKFNGIIAANGGEVVKVEEWGKRRLAYAIDYKTEGYYVYVAFNGASELPKELSRNLGINENVIRSQIVKLLEKKSSVKPRPVRVAPVSEETPAEAAPAEQA